MSDPTPAAEPDALADQVAHHFAEVNRRGESFTGADVAAEFARRREESARHAETVSPETTQSRIWANKVAKGFNTTDVPMELCLLQAEVAEFFEAWKRGRTDALPGELADIAIFAYGLAEMCGVDLDQAVLAKVEKNATRVYRPTSRGHVQHALPPAKSTGDADV